MSKGRIPRPKVVSDLRGDMRHGRKDAIEPDAPTGVPDMPDYLAADAVAAAEWEATAPLLSTMGVLTLADRAALEMYCSAYSRYRKAEEQVRRFGEIIKSPNNYPIQSPYVSVMNKNLDQCRRLLIEMGLTPAARSRMRVQPGDTDKGDIISFIARRA